MVDYLERLLDQAQEQDERQEEAELLEERLPGMTPGMPQPSVHYLPDPGQSPANEGEEGQTAIPFVQMGSQRQGRNRPDPTTNLSPTGERTGVPERLLAELERQLMPSPTGPGEEGRSVQGAQEQGAQGQGVLGQAVLGPGLAAACPLLPVPAPSGGQAAAGPPSAGGDAGLRRLYRQVRAASWEQGAAQTAGMAVSREAALPQQSGLTMGQLDRAMRRDSRRYDGGMSIY